MVVVVVVVVVTAVVECSLSWKCSHRDGRGRS